MPRAVSLADKLLAKFKNRLAEVALVPSSGGVFEVMVDGKKVYSKLATGTFPDENKLLADMDGVIK